MVRRRLAVRRLKLEDDQLVFSIDKAPTSLVGKVILPISKLREEVVDAH